MNRAVLLVGCLCLVSPTAADELRAGVAEADVTPAVGTPLAGYGGRLLVLDRRPPDLNPFNRHALFKPSTGVRDPIEAQALVLERGQTTVALLTLDAIGVEQRLLDDIRRGAVQRGVPLPPGALFVAASHTHSGPGALSRRLLWQVAACDRFHRGVHRRLVAGLVDLLARAWAERQPATLASASQPLPGLTRNRRAGRSTRVDTDDVDPRLRVLRVDDAAGRPLAALLNFAVHPTCLGDDNLAFSADVAGAARREAKRRLGYPVLFTNGSAGDVSPNPGGERGLRLVGERLGAAVAALAPRAQPLGAGLAYANAERELGPLVYHPRLGEDQADSQAGPILAALKRLGPGIREPLLSTRFRYAALRLGPLVMLFVPGEPITELGRQLEQDAAGLGFADAWVVSLANGHMGYITTPEEYDEGGYEAWLTFYGRETSRRLREALTQALTPLAPF